MSDPVDDWHALIESRAKAERQTWAVTNLGAVITPDIEWTPAVQGPTIIPWRNMSGKDEGYPHHPGLHGRYLVIDLDANNRAQVDEIRERFPDHPGFGWGVCRQGFGLQSFGDGYMSERVATARAKALNSGQPAYEIVNA